MTSPTMRDYSNLIEEALSYSRHDDICPAPAGGPCSCGLVEAHKKVRACLPGIQSLSAHPAGDVALLREAREQLNDVSAITGNIEWRATLGRLVDRIDAALATPAAATTDASEECPFCNGPNQPCEWCYYNSFDEPDAAATTDASEERDVMLGPRDEWEIAGVPEFDVTLPGGGIFECVALDENDALAEAKKHHALQPDAAAPTDAGALVEAAAKLIADVRRRYPGEELRCEYMIALDNALANLSKPTEQEVAMTKQPKEPAILSDPLAQAWRRGDLVRGHVMTPQPMSPKPTEQATSPAPDAVLREKAGKMIEEILAPLLLTSDTSIKLRIFWKWLDAALASSKPTGCEGERERYRHKKRGTEYTVIGEAELQMNCDLLVDGSQMVVYRGEDGRLWVREESEFHDGRFERLAASLRARTEEKE